MEEGIGHILDLTPIGEKRKESLKDPASIEAPQASFHQVVIRAQELQVGAP